MHRIRRYKIYGGGPASSFRCPWKQPCQIIPTWPQIRAFIIKAIPYNNSGKYMLQILLFSKCLCCRFSWISRQAYRTGQNYNVGENKIMVGFYCLRIQQKLSFDNLISKIWYYFKNYQKNENSMMAFCTLPIHSGWP